MFHRALIIVGHGTRNPAGQRELRTLAGMVAETLPEWVVEPCFLELAEPDVATGIDRMAARGATEIVTLPLLLFAAGHAKRDIPELLAAARRRHPGVRFLQAGHLGCHQELVELSVLRYREGMAGAAPRPKSKSLLLLVGRGSRDPSANAEMAQFARLRFEAAPVGWYEVAFAALAEPSLSQTIEMVSRLPFSRIVVQPHLLFQGDLHDNILVAAAAAAARYPQFEWIMVSHLGCHPGLVRAVQDRCLAAASAWGPA